MGVSHAPSQGAGGQRPRNFATSYMRALRTTKCCMVIELDVRFFFTRSTTNTDARGLFAVASLHFNSACPLVI